jgi:xanthine dehydrogenase molybdenum-binding subunit
MAQIVAEELGVRFEDIIVIGDDTDLAPFDLGCFGSRSTYVCGNAALSCAKDTKKEVFEVAAEMLEIDPDQLTASQGQIWVKEEPERKISFSEVANFTIKRRGRPISGKGRFFDPLAPGAVTRKIGELLPSFSFGCQVAVVEVDLETGEVNVLRLISAHDSGTIINTMGAESQVEGALAQGLGYALMENIILENGTVANSNFLDYKIPTSLDVPQLKTIFVNTYEPSGPFGAKGLGEPGLVASAPAITNAVYDAIGIRFNELPITPEKILTALKEKRAKLEEHV